MSVRAKLSYLRIAPRKVRLVADLIRGKSVEEAETILNFTLKKGAKPLLKLLKQALANAKNQFSKVEESNFYISKILVNEGPKLKRWKPRARGQVYQIQKKTSHITLVLDEISKKPQKIRKIEKVEKGGELEKEVKEKIVKIPKPKFRPEIEKKGPEVEKRIKRIFRRKAF